MEEKIARIAELIGPTHAARPFVRSGVPTTRDQTSANQTDDPWTLIERMNRNLKEATVQRYHHESQSGSQRVQKDRPTKLRNCTANIGVRTDEPAATVLSSAVATWW